MMAERGTSTASGYSPQPQPASAKEEILAAIRSSIRTGFPGAASDVPLPVRNYRMRSDYAPGSPELIAQMTQMLTDYGAMVREVPYSDVSATIDEYLRSARSVVVPSGLAQEWKDAAGAQRTVYEDSPDRPLTHRELDAIDATVTASRLGIAISGTIVLDSEPDQGRRAISLVPDTHVCILKASEVYGLVPEAVDVLARHPQRPATWIAGPSATSDIELTRVNGVHGPRNLKVIIYS